MLVPVCVCTRMCGCVWTLANTRSAKNQSADNTGEKESFLRTYVCIDFYILPTTNKKVAIWEKKIYQSHASFLAAVCEVREAPLLRASRTCG